jgi:Calx-beta domain
MVFGNFGELIGTENNDSLNSSSSNKTILAEIEGRHLYLFNQTTKDGVLILDWQKPDNRIEQFITTYLDGTTSTQTYNEFVNNINLFKANPAINPNITFLENITWAEFDARPEIDLTLEINQVIGKAKALENPSSVRFKTAAFSGEEGKKATITLTRTGGDTLPSTVEVSITGGSATASTDYDNSGFPLKITFDPGQKEKTFDIVFPLRTENCRFFCLIYTLLYLSI